MKSILKFFINKINQHFLVKKIIFYHVPRSSGTSIKFFFRKYCGLKSYIEDNSFKNPSKILEERNNYRKKYVLMGHISYSESFKNQSSLYEFTILRNPIERYLSQYSYLLNFDVKKKPKKSNNIIQRKKLNLSEWIELVKKKNYDNILTRMFCYKANNPDFETEDDNFNKDIIVRNDDLKIAIYNLEKINIYLFETLDRKILYKNLGFKIFFDEFWENKSTKMNNLTEEELKMIKSICEFDYKIYEHFLNSNFVNR